MKIEVLKIRTLKDKGNLKGFASVRIADKITIHSCRIVQQSGQRPWVSMPQESYTNKEGKSQWNSLVEIPEDWKQPINNAVVSAYQEQLSENQDTGGEWNGGGEW